jgi:hypothetical protein
LAAAPDWAKAGAAAKASIAPAVMMILFMSLLRCSPVTTAWYGDRFRGRRAEHRAVQAMGGRAEMNGCRLVR